ncbi:uncharacterized protein LOC126825305 [Patella vulgata]|uniref:uncharacterized protein LOC126825305 n=1 Tax=Patella vulgata TaxID=6465 RepID=UPI00217FC3DC|nr:uncharacterized protein LOC126825305 [Patella vulgata]
MMEEESVDTTASPDGTRPDDATESTETVAKAAAPVDIDRKDVKRREKSRGRFRRKRHSKTQSVPDLDTKLRQDGTAQFLESKKAGNDGKYNSMPRKSRSRSGSANRFSGLFKRKSRSASEGRSRSETDIVGNLEHEATNKVETNDDGNEEKEIKNNYEEYVSYVRYSPTKQPRNRLKRMTVRDAVVERRLRNTLFVLNQKSNEEGNTLSNSLPDVSNIDSNDSSLLIQAVGDDTDDTFNKKSVTLPRDKKHKIRKNIDTSKSVFDDRTLLIHCDINGNGAGSSPETVSSPSRVEIRNVTGTKESSKESETKCDSDNDSDEFFECSDSIASPAVDDKIERSEAQNSYRSSLSTQDVESETNAKAVADIVYKSSNENIQKLREESRSLFLELSRNISARKDSLVTSRDASPHARLTDKRKYSNVASLSQDEKRGSLIGHKEPITKHLLPDISVQNKDPSLLTKDTTKSKPGEKTVRYADQIPDESPDVKDPEKKTNSGEPRTTDSLSSNCSDTFGNFTLIYQPVLAGYKMSPGIKAVDIKPKKGKKKKAGKGKQSKDEALPEVAPDLKPATIENEDDRNMNPELKDNNTEVGNIQNETMSSNEVNVKGHDESDFQAAPDLNNLTIEQGPNAKRSSDSHESVIDERIDNETPENSTNMTLDTKSLVDKNIETNMTPDLVSASSPIPVEANPPPQPLIDRENLLNIPKPRTDRSLSDGIVDYSNGERKSPRTFQRSSSAKSPPPTSAEYQVSESEHKNVPIMGTSLSRKYRRTFSPQRGNTDFLQLPKGITLLDPSTSPNVSSMNRESLSEINKSKSSSPDEGISLHGDDDGDISMVTGVVHRGVTDQDNQFSTQKKAKIGRTFRTSEEMGGQKSPDTKTVDEKQSAKIQKSPENVSDDRFVEISTQTNEDDIRAAIKLMIKQAKEQKKREKAFAKRKKDFVSIVDEPKREREQQQQSVDPESSNAKEAIFEVKTALPTPEIRVADDDNITVSPSLSAIESPVCPTGETPVAHDVIDTEEIPKETKDVKGGKGSNKKKKVKHKSILKNRFSKKYKKKKKSTDSKEVQEEKYVDAPTTKLEDDTFIFIENEINLSKLAEIKETDILDDDIIEPDESIQIPTKHLRFDTINIQPIQGEEPLPPLSQSGRLSRRRDSTMREKRKKCLNAFKTFVAFLFSHIGLCSLVVGYTIMGGFVFKAIEGPYERSIKTGIREQRVKLIDKLIQHAFELQMSKSGRDDFMEAVNKELLKFQTKIHRETKENGWDGNDAKEFSDMQWSFASALLYAITVMTTIGYGHVAPKTPEGRIVTIGYAVLGIPLTLLCLTNIGDVMATGFRLLYGKVCCGVCCKLFSPKRRRIPDPEKGLSRVVDTGEQEAGKPKEVIHVPTSLCILLIAGYIFSGALLFSLWEQWDYLTGSYFCFITLSTIGFGDIVPGTDLQAWAGEEKLVLCALYLVFGLSLIAMCFNLVQEDVKNKCRWLGMKMGIIDKPEAGVLE